MMFDLKLIKYFRIAVIGYRFFIRLINTLFMKFYYDLLFCCCFFVLIVGTILFFFLYYNKFLVNSSVYLSFNSASKLFLGCYCCKSFTICRVFECELVQNNLLNNRYCINSDQFACHMKKILRYESIGREFHH